MKNLKYSNSNIEEEFKRVLASHSVVPSIIDALCEDDKKATIMDIKTDTFNIQVIVSINKKLYNLYIDLLAKKIKVVNPCESFVTIYDDMPRKHITPVGFEYQKGERIVYKRNVFLLCDSSEKRNYYQITDNDNKYDLIVSYTNIEYNENDFINKLLSEKDISNIRKLFIKISKFLNFNLFNIKLTDTKGSIIIMDKGDMVKYLEYQENDKHYEKIYLENDIFYIEKVVKEKYDDENINLIKEIGGYNGKKEK